MIGARIVICAAILMPSLDASAIETTPETNNRMLIVSMDRRLYMIDFSAGTASQLPVPIDSSSIFLLSPDQNYFVMSGQNGVAVYRFSGSTISKVGQITESPARGIGWSADGKNLSYVHEVRNQDGSMTMQIFLWNRETGQTKRLL
jgi:Tol biopolymer transport system component